MKQLKITNLQKDKIRLAYLAWKDMNQLSKSPDYSLLKHVSDSKLNEMNLFFRQVGESLQEVMDAFGTWEFTLYPKISIGFDSSRNVLIVNLWSWMFSMLSNTEQPEVGFAPLCLKAPELAHEFQHYIYLKQHEMMHASEEESELFRGNMEA